MKAHDLAMKLLAMDDQWVCIVCPTTGEQLNIETVQYNDDENDCSLIELVS